MFQSYDHLQAENMLLDRITQLTIIIYFLPEDGRTTEK
jgi:hypothetical protein